MSVYWQDLEAGGPCTPNDGQLCEDAKFTWNGLNSWSARSHLVPKAIGYSAGLLEYFFQSELEGCYGGAATETLLKNNTGVSLHGSVDVYVDNSVGVRTLLASYETEARLPPEAEGVWEPGKILSIPAFDPPASGSVLVVFHGDMGPEHPGLESPGGVLAVRVPTGNQCNRFLWKTAVNGVVEYALGQNGMPTGSGTVIIPSASLPAITGVAHDPTDGTLWIAVDDDDGVLRKMDRDGDILASITVSDTFPMPGTGLPQGNFTGLSIDPDDPDYLWTSGRFGPFGSGTGALYKIRKGDGVVVSRCTMNVAALVGGGGGNLLLAVGKRGGFTMVVAKPVDGGFFNRGNDVFPYYPSPEGGMEGACPGSGMWTVFPVAQHELNAVPFAVELVGGPQSRFIAVVQDADELNSYIYNFGRPSNAAIWAIQQYSVRVPFSMDEDFGDISMGSAF